MVNYNRDKNTYQRKKKRQNEALQLQKFISNSGPVMEKVIEENLQMYQLFDNRKAAAKRNAVELK